MNWRKEGLIEFESSDSLPQIRIVCFLETFSISSETIMAYGKIIHQKNNTFFSDAETFDNIILF